MPSLPTDHGQSLTPTDHGYYLPPTDHHGQPSTTTGKVMDLDAEETSEETTLKPLDGCGFVGRAWRVAHKGARLTCDGPRV